MIKLRRNDPVFEAVANVRDDLAGLTDEQISRVFEMLIEDPVGARNPAKIATIKMVRNLTNEDLYTCKTWVENAVASGAVEMLTLEEVHRFEKVMNALRSGGYEPMKRKPAAPDYARRA